MPVTRRAAGTLTALVLLVSVSLAAAQERLAPSQIAGAMPSSQPGPLEKRAKRITPQNPVPRRTYFVAAVYPAEAAGLGLRSSVTLRVTLDENGHMGELRLANVPLLGSWSSPDSDVQMTPAVFNALIAAARFAVSQWQYDAPVDGPISFDVSIRFGPDEDPAVVLHGRPPDTAGSRLAVQTAPFAPIDFSGFIPAWAEGVVRAGGQIRVPTKVKHVNPVYPQEARESGTTGVLIIEARVEPDGRIIHARTLRSIPRLDQAALAAVTQWEFTPTLVNGRAVPVLVLVTIQFSLP